MKPVGVLARLSGLIAVVCALHVAPAAAATVQIAVASNFMEPAKEIATAFTAQTGHQANLSFAPSGQIYVQLTHGAPFEVFLSADKERPQQAEKNDFSVYGTRFTYAVGRLVLYSTKPSYVDANGKVLTRDDFNHLAIADPAIAPYGLAAVQSLRKLGLYDRLKPKTVQGSSIAQTFQFVQTGAAEIGFVAQSQVINRPDGSRWIVPATLHSPIDQQAVLLKTGANNPAAKAFMTFLKSATARAIIRRYGYETP
jgi:molybdate transport system substrate-binding protein